MVQSLATPRHLFAALCHDAPAELSQGPAALCLRNTFNSFPSTLTLTLMLPPPPPALHTCTPVRQVLGISSPPTPAPSTLRPASAGTQRRSQQGTPDPSCRTAGAWVGRGTRSSAGSWSGTASAPGLHMGAKAGAAGPNARRPASGTSGGRGAGGKGVVGGEGGEVRNALVWDLSSGRRLEGYCNVLAAGWWARDAGDVLPGASPTGGTGRARAPGNRHCFAVATADLLQVLPAPGLPASESQGGPVAEAFYDVASVDCMDLGSCEPASAAGGQHAFAFAVGSHVHLYHVKL